MLLLEQYEQEILSMLISSDRDMQNIIINSLSEKMFTNRFYRKVFEVSKNLHVAGQDLNLYSIMEYLHENAKDILFLHDNYITNVNYKYFVEKIQKAYFERQAKNIKTVEDMRILQNEMDKYTDTSVLHHISYASENILKIYNSENNIIPTGYKCIDDIIGGLQGGDLLILAARPAMGKTCMALNIAKNIAKTDKHVDFFSLEMPELQLKNRIICSDTSINAKSFRTRSLHPWELESYDKYIKNNLPKLNINLSEKYDITVSQLRSIVKKSDSNIVFVDYLGLLSGGENKTSYERMGEISRQMKIATLATNKPFVVLHQLNRAVADRQDKTPRLSDLRDSGKIEQDADFVCFVHRPAYDSPETEDPNKLQFIIGKSRHTEGNKIVDLFYEERYQSIKEVA